MAFRFNRMLSLGGDIRKLRFRGRTALKSAVDGTFNESPLFIEAFVDNKPERIEYAEPFHWQ